VRKIDKRGMLYYSYDMKEDNNLLLLSEDFEFDNNDDLFEKAYDKYSKVISKVPLLRFNAFISILIILLPCRYKAHFKCIDNKSKLYSKCPSIDDLEKEGYYILLIFNKATKKKKRKDDLHKSTKGYKRANYNS